MTEEANRIIKTIKQMEASLEDRAANNAYQLDEKELKVTIPLTRCLQDLKEKHNAVAKIHRERFEQVKSEDALKLKVSSLTIFRARSSSRILLLPP